ncbi:MAG TPA: ABC transporter permease [Pseudolabrys sp.]|nr:ABC transporter permease [Pseudolabrys sp.]
MAGLVHWRYVASELGFRWKRTALLVAGIALAVTLVTTLDILSRAFADLATVPFRNLGADLIVQRSAVQSAVPKDMGIILPYSAEPITSDELKRLAAEPGVSQAAGFVLLWNLGKGRFISITGVPFGPDAPALGPGKVSQWLIQGRLPNAGAREVLVERHYGAFFRLTPGSKVEIGGEQYAVTGVADILEGSQIVASNFYMDIDEARRLAKLPANLVNQVFLKLSDMAQTESVKNRIAAWLPQASVTSPGTMLQLFGGVSQTIGRFRIVAVLAGALAALALAATFVFGNLVERSRELAILRVIGWEQSQVRREIAAEMVLQGLIAGLLALGLLAAGSVLLAHISINMPASLPGENPASFAAGDFHLGASTITLPVTLTVWDWLCGPLAATVALGICGWWMATDRKSKSLWAAIRA